MKSIKELFIIGPGPSSSHTIGPYKASLLFLDEIREKNLSFNNVKVILYGSLALTGKGHFTDEIIKKVFKNCPCEVVFDFKNQEIEHPNTMDFLAFNDNDLVYQTRIYSLGGGVISKTTKENATKDIYSLNTLNEIKNFMEINNIETFNEFVDRFEDNDLNKYLEKSLDIMFKSIESGLSKTGKLPGKLALKRVANDIYNDALHLGESFEKESMIMTAYAYALAEENASGEMVVTAPTCGSCGVLPAILYYSYKFKYVSKESLIKALKVAGLFGNLIKENASISGAVLGCQAEIGTASVMAAAALSSINNLNNFQIEYASEVALEHFLGLTCDPVMGYVQIPCIERNGIGTLRALESYFYAKNIAPFRKNAISFDNVVIAMKKTGESLSNDYKETSVGGLANVIK